MMPQFSLQWRLPAFSKALLFLPMTLSCIYNTAPQPLPEAGARDERTLEAVRCSAWFSPLCTTWLLGGLISPRPDYCAGVLLPFVTSWYKNSGAKSVPLTQRMVLSSLSSCTVWKEVWSRSSSNIPPHNSGARLTSPWVPSANWSHRRYAAMYFKVERHGTKVFTPRVR